MKICFIIMAVFITSFLSAQSRKEIAETFIGDLSQQKFTEAESLTDSVFQHDADTAFLKKIWMQSVRQLGHYNGIDSSKEINQSSYKVFLDFADAKQAFSFSFNGEAKITGLRNAGVHLKDNFHFAQKELSVKANGGTIKGSLMMPDNFSSKTPVALIIAGSGPTDRNGNTPLSPVKLDTYKLLADALAENGIASFRYDKRLLGKSNNFKFEVWKYVVEDDVADADSVLYFLKKEYRKVYVIGHSEGSLIGMLCSEKYKPNGFISLEGAGENIELTMKRQLADYRDTAEVDSILSALKNGNQVKTVPPGLQILFAPVNQPYIISWMKYEPEEEIKKLKCRVLIVQGDSDWNVKIKDAENLKKAKPNAHLTIVKGMSHQLINAEKPINKLCPEMMNAVIAFIRK